MKETTSVEFFTKNLEGSDKPKTPQNPFKKIYEELREKLKSRAFGKLVIALIE